MSTAPATGYHFTTTAQWQECLLAQAGSSVAAGVTSVEPFAPYLSRPAPSFISNGAFAPAYTRGRVTVWRDADAHLLRVYDGDALPERYTAPAAIGSATRIIGTATDLWVGAAAPDSLQCFDVESFSRRVTVDLSPGRVLDIARDANAGIVALLREDASLFCVHVSCSGAIGARVKLEGMQGEANVLGFGVVGAPAGNSGVFAVLTRGPADAGDRLYWFAQTGGAHFKVTQLAMYAPCFEATALTGDPTGRLYVAGTDNHGSGPRSHVMIFDAASILIDDVNLYERPTGIATSRDALLVTGAGGLYVLAATDTVPDDVNQVRGMILTPVLESPDVPDGRRWLRVEIVCDLPEGATLQILCGATDDVAVRDRLNAMAATTLPAGQRVQSILAEPGIWQPPVSLHGSASPPPQAGVPFAAPLYDIHARYLWVCVTMVAGAGANLPSISRLSVLYPGRTLMQNLPALYQRDEATPGRFLRALVGVLETTTHTLDDTISSLGANIHPDTAGEAWLDYLARWLGLPWDDTLDVSQKRAIVEHAEVVAAQRGTRAGLGTLLACLLPGTPMRYRISDFTVDYGMAMVGGSSCTGSALPALLGGLPQSAARLDVQATLGCMRLPCGIAEVDPFARFVGLLVVDVAATAAEKKQWTPWFANVLSNMVPLTARLQIRWLGPAAFADRTLGDTLILEHPSNPRLGTDAVTGQVWLPEGASTLPARAERGGFTLH
jgi:phage tail-like protein